MRFLFTGYYGYKNAGDDAFMTITNWAIKKYWNTNEYAFITPKTFKDDSLPRKFLFKKMRYSHHYLSTIYFSLFSKYIIYSGGSLFRNNITIYSTQFVLKLYNKLFGLKLGAIGISIGPFSNKKAYTNWKNYLEKFDFITVRDTASYDIAKEMNLSNVIQSFDIAALYPEYIGYEDLRSLKREKIIGVSICSFAKNKYINSFKELIMLLKDLNDYRFQFYIFSGDEVNGDIIPTLETIKQMAISNYEIINYTHPDQIFKNIATCSILLGMRLHSGIFAAFSDTPFILIEYEKKCTDFLNDIGYPDKYRVGILDSDMNKIKNNVLEILNNKELFQLSKKDDCRNKALLNFTSTYNIIKK